MRRLVPTHRLSIFQPAVAWPLMASTAGSGPFAATANAGISRPSRSDGRRSKSVKSRSVRPECAFRPIMLAWRGCGTGPISFASASPRVLRWRRGDTAISFGRRRRRHGAAITTVAVGVAAVYAAGIVAGGVGFAVANLAVGLSSRAWSKRRVLRSDIGGIARTRALAEHQFTRRK
jgi:hypothetical protein